MTRAWARISGMSSEKTSNEILELADRVAVMSEGRIAYLAPVAKTDRATIGHAMAGHG